MGISFSFPSPHNAEGRALANGARSRVVRVVALARRIRAPRVRVIAREPEAPEPLGAQVQEARSQRGSRVRVQPHGGGRARARPREDLMPPARRDEERVFRREPRDEPARGRGRREFAARTVGGME